MAIHEELFKELMLHEFATVTDENLAKLGALIDTSTDLQKTEGLNYAKTKIANLLSSNLDNDHKAILYFYFANIWEGLRVLKTKDTQASWDWHQEEIEQTILNLRLSAKYSSDKFPYLCPVHTNLGNMFSHIGRFVEAIDYWNAALKVCDSFAMAIANKGYGLSSYAYAIYDSGHKLIFLKFAYDYLKQGLKGKYLHETAIISFQKISKDIEGRVNKEYLESEITLPDYKLGKTIAEKNYRKWCLQKCLFLNPLNDLGPFSIAARDILHCPSITTTISEHDSPNPPVYYAFYNQLKQEYVSARFLLYECLKSNKSHFSDRDVLIYNTLDYSCFGLNVEQAKISFRMIYSLFDKIAFFLNCYLKLQVPDRNIAFKTIWYNNQHRAEGLHKIFSQMRNWPFRGLFWLAKDLSEQRTEFADSIEPDAQDLVTIRNFIEHKFLTLHQMDLVNFIEPQTKDVTYPVYFQDFADKTLRLMKLARAALIYLSLGVHIEEKKKHTNGESQIIGQMPLTAWEDSWKTHF